MPERTVWCRACRIGATPRSVSASATAGGICARATSCRSRREHVLHTGRCLRGRSRLNAPVEREWFAGARLTLARGRLRRRGTRLLAQRLGSASEYLSSSD